MVRPRAAGCSRRTANKRCVTFPGLLCLQGCGSGLRLSQCAVCYRGRSLRCGVSWGREWFCLGRSWCLASLNVCVGVLPGGCITML
jgi:hypothetical protein